MLDLSDSPLGVKASQVHSDATKRGTVQHMVLEHPSLVMNVGHEDEFEFFVTCEEDGGRLEAPVPYGLAVTLEVKPGTQLPIYEQVRDRLAQRVVVPTRAR